MRRRCLFLLASFLGLVPAYGAAQTATYHLHKESSAINGAFDRLLPAGPDAASTVLTTSLKSKAAGEYVIKEFETQSGDPGLSGVVPSGTTITFDLFMRKTAAVGTVFPRVHANLNNASGANLCTVTGATALTTTVTKQTLNCVTSADVSLTASDRFYIWVGVNLTGTSTTAFNGELDIEGALNGNFDSQVSGTLPTPHITSVSPASGAAGNAISIVGTNFASSQGVVTFNGVAASVSSWSNTNITALVPAGATTGNIVVTPVTQIASNSFFFKILNPGGLAIDQIVSADNNALNTSVSTPAFSTTSANQVLLAFASSGRIPTTTGTTHPAVNSVTGGGLTWVLVKRTNVQQGTAEIWRAFASAALANITVTATFNQSIVSSLTVISFTGADTSGTNGSGAVGATGTGNGATGLPSATLTTTRNKSLVFGAGNDPTAASARQPAAGQVIVHQSLCSTGTPCSTVKGTLWVQQVALPVATSGTSITVNDTAPSGDPFNLSLVEVLPATAANPAPVITSLAPTAGQVGSMVAINGSNFGATQGTSTVTFGGVNASVVTWSATQIQATVPTGVALGAVPVVVNVPGAGTSNAATFTVVAPLAVVATPAPAANANHWNNTNVTISYACVGGVPPVACPAQKVVTTEGANQIITATATDAVGSQASVSVTLNIDKTNPAITAAVSPVPVNGVVTAPATVTFTCTDSLSGVASCPAAISVTTAGLNQTFNGTDSDRAGNSASASLTFSVQTAPLKVTAAAAPPANAANWNNANVTVTFTCSGGVSPINCPAAQIVNTEGANQVISGSVTDAAGQTASASVTLNIDKTNPTITATVSPLPVGGVVLAPATITFACSDLLSGVAVCPPPISVTTAGLNQIFSGTATDRAGNSASATLTFSVELTPLVVTATAAPPANAANWNNTNVTVTFTCSGGVPPINCPAPQIVSTEGANQVISGSATDASGQTASASVTLNIDKTNPIIAATASPIPGPGGNVAAPVTVTFNCSDALSGIAICPSPVTITAAGVGQVVSGTTFDKAGNSASASLTLNVIQAALSVTVVLTPAPNSARWNNTDMTVSFVCAGGVPPLQCPGPQIVTTEGANQIISASVTDSLGQTASTSVTLNIDKTPPGISATVFPTPDATGLINAATARVTFSCVDGLSGIAFCPATVDVSTAGLQTITVNAIDAAGNTTPTTATFTLRTPPTQGLSVTTTLSPQPNTAGWNNSPVTVTFQCSGGRPPLTCPGPQTVSTDSSNQIVAGTATDADGTQASTSVTVKLDQTPPMISITSPTSGVVLHASTTSVSGSVSDLLSGATAVSCNGLPGTISGSSFSCANVELASGSNSLSVQATDIAGNFSTATATTTFVRSPQISITSPARDGQFSQNPINVAGTVDDPSATVNVNGIVAPVNGSSFLATVPLREGTNTITAVAQNGDGTTTTASLLVNLDTTPPHVAIYSPVDGAITTESSVTVAGMVNDIVVGTVNSPQAAVTVNGVSATVGNRNFNASAVPLAIGPNSIQAVAVDSAGNQATATVTIIRQAAGIPSVQVVSGDGQAGSIRTPLAQPLVARLLKANGAPMPFTPIVFHVVSQDGTVNTSPGPGLSDIAVNTDAQGQASVFFTLGSHSGAGNNLVEASSSGVRATAVFSASATATNAALINVDAGNNQNGATEQALALPFVAVVTDGGHNRVAGVPVTFSVTKGGGTIDGLTSTTVFSDNDGRAVVTLALGRDEGINNNVVEANFPGNAGFAAAFTATGKRPGPASATSVSGIVLDNSNQPIPGVTMRMFQLNRGPSGNLPQQVGTPVVTGPDGRFTIQPAPVGVFKLMADGGTAQRDGLYPYPTLEYDIDTVPGQDNTVGSPIYLPRLSSLNRACVSETKGGTVTMADAPGFALTIAPGSATFPGGSRSGCVSVTAVNMDKVPMAPGFGQQPRFIVTIQPVGTTFNPPAAITIPNVDGLKPRAVTEMYSYDHDLASFVSIGTATVSDDGSLIKSDPGVGVIKAGWHCGGDPNTTGTAATCPDCQKCDGNNCVTDPGQNGAPVKDDKCKVCKDGSPSPIDINNTKTEVSISFEVPDEATEKLNKGLEELKDFGIIAKVNLLSIEGTLESKECCGKETGKGHETKGSVSGDFGGASLEVKVWPPLGPIPRFTLTIEVVGVATITAKGEFDGGVFLGVAIKVKGEIGRKKDECSEKAEARDGCIFAKLQTTLTGSAKAQLAASGSISYECPVCEKQTIAIAATLSLGDFSWPINLTDITFNEPECGAGLAGGFFHAESATFKIGGSFSGSVSVLGIKREVKFSKDVLKCTINFSNPSCTFFP